MDMVMLLMIDHLSNKTVSKQPNTHMVLYIKYHRALLVLIPVFSCAFHVHD